jgi:Uma2 family endonuclease
MISERRAGIDDLRRVPNHGKAELVDGKVKLMSPTGGRPARAGGKVYASLLRHEEERGGGYALPDNAGFIVALPNRQSFSPDAAWYTGTTIDMSFLNGAPAFAAAVRREIADKIADYFAAGTLVVWDVDLLSPDIIRKYASSRPTEPLFFPSGEIADAEPAVPGWRLRVDDLLK